MSEIISLADRILGRQLLAIAEGSELQRERITAALLDVGFVPEYAELASLSLLDDWLNESPVPFWCRETCDFCEQAVEHHACAACIPRPVPAPAQLPAGTLADRTAAAIQTIERRGWTMSAERLVTTLEQLAARAERGEVSQ